jgi:hypothetical protein
MNYHRRALIQEEAWALDHAQFHATSTAAVLTLQWYLG